MENIRIKRKIKNILILGSLVVTLAHAEVARGFFVYESFPLFQEQSLRQDAMPLGAGFAPLTSAETNGWEAGSRQIVFRAEDKRSSGLLFGNEDWGDFLLTVDVSFQNGDRAGFLFHYQDSANFYRLELNKASGRAILSRVIEGQETVLDEESVAFQIGPNHIYLDFYQDEISLFVNERPILLVKDQRLTKGKAAFYVWDSLRISFKNPEINYKREKATVLSHLNDMVVTAGSPVDFSVFADKIRLSDMSLQAMQIPEGAVFANGSFRWPEPRVGQYQAEFEVRAGSEVERKRIAVTVFDKINEAMAINQLGEANEQAASSQLLRGLSEPLRLGRTEEAVKKSLDDLKKRKKDQAVVDQLAASQNAATATQNTNSNIDYSHLSNPTVILGGGSPLVRGSGLGRPQTGEEDENANQDDNDDTSNGETTGGDQDSDPTDDTPPSVPGDNDTGNDDQTDNPTDNDNPPDNDKPDDLPPPVPPQAPVLKPAVLGTIPGEVELIWSDESASGAKIYRVDISREPEFIGTQEDIWTTSTSIKKVLTTPGTYYARIKAFISGPPEPGVSSPSSNTITFSISKASSDFDILSTLNKVIVFNELPSSTSAEVLADVTAQDGQALKFHYDVAGQSFTGLAFSSPAQPIQDIAKYKTLKYRLRRGDGAEGLLRFILEFKSQGKVLGNVLISDIDAAYTDQSFPLFLDGAPVIDEVTLVAVGDSDPDGIGDLWIDSLSLTEAEYVPPTTPAIPEAKPRTISDEAFLDQLEADMAYYFFRETIGPGFVKDSNKSEVASIAATGFGLAALAVLADRYDPAIAHWSRVTPDQARARAHILLGHLLDMQQNQELLSDIYGVKGFFYHFIDSRGKRAGFCEVSSADTALLVAGALVAGEYFGGTIKERADQLYQNVDWTMFLDRDAKQYFHAWKPERSRGFTIYREGGFLATTRWNLPTDEVLLISLLAIGNHPQDQDIVKSYFGYPREARSYTFKTGSETGTTVPVVNSFLGSMFTYFYANCFFDFKTLGPDRPENVNGAPYPASVNWWQNSVNAIKANRDFAVSRSKYFPFSLDQGNSWGFSATERPDGRYEGLYGAPPSFQGAGHDGTVAVTMAAAALPFFREGNTQLLTGNPAFDTLSYYDRHFRNDLFGEYGLVASYNNKGEFSTTFLGIDSGSALLMIENFRSGLIWETLAMNSRIAFALQMLYRTPVNLFDLTLLGLENDLSVDTLSFGVTEQGTPFGFGKQYVKIDYMLAPQTAMALFTDNRNNLNAPYQGDCDAAGLVGVTDPLQVVPLRWVVFDEAQTQGYEFVGDFKEGLVQDKSMLGFTEFDALMNRTIVDADGALADYPQADRKSRQETVYLYFGADYRDASAQDYATETLTFEVYQRT